MSYSAPALPAVFSPGQYGMAQHVIFHEDFVTGGKGTTIAHKFATTADAAEWLQVVDNSGTVVITDAQPGGVITMNPGTGALDFISLQLNGESFAVRNNKKMWFNCRIALDDADDAMWCIGLSRTDVTGTTKGPILDSIIAAEGDFIGFGNVVGTTADIYYIIEDDTSQTKTDSTYDLSDSTFVELGFFLNGRSYIEMYVNGNRVVKTATNIPDNNAAVTPTIEVCSTTGTTATSMLVDYITVIMER
jgi:hypothetical protein